MSTPRREVLPMPTTPSSFVLWLLTACALPTATAPAQELLRIGEIQGRGARSPQVGEVVRVEGTVTQRSFDGRDIWIQDRDGDDATSDGIRVVGAGLLPEPPAPGTRIRLVGTVVEAQFRGGLPITQLISPRDLDALGQVDLPTPITLTDLPLTSIADAITFWEAHEGMRVEVTHAPVVAPSNEYGEFAVVPGGLARHGSGWTPASQILVRPLDDGSVDYNPERILVVTDDLDSVSQAVIPGDVAARLVGVVDYSFGNYKVVLGQREITRRPRPDRSVSQRHGPPGDVTIATFNVENLFDLEDDPRTNDQGTTPTEAELEVRLAKLALALRFELQLPAVIAVQEVEHEAILQQLADRVNAHYGTQYRAVSRGSSDGRGIENAYLWNETHATLLECRLLDDQATRDAFGPESPSPGREPLLARFRIAGREVVMLNNHLKSKWGDDGLFGAQQPPARDSEIKRKPQALALRGEIDRLLAADPDVLLLVAGDFNDFQFAEPGEGVDHPLALVQGSGTTALTSVVERVPWDQRYTYVYQGNSQVLDHILLSPALARLFVAGDALHFNARYPDVYGTQVHTPLRCSDHDALEARFIFGAAPDSTNTTPRSPSR